MRHQTSNSSEKLQPTPRATVEDSFEQNPLPEVHNRVAEPQLEEEGLERVPEEIRMKEAVRRILHQQVSLEDAARDLNLSASSIQHWASSYASLLRQKSFGESNPAAAEEDAAIAFEAQRKFSDNWANLLEDTHAAQENSPQDSFKQLLHTSPITRWLYKDNGRLDHFTILGMAVVLLGMAAVLAFTLSDKSAPASPTFRVEIHRTLEVQLPTEDLHRASTVVQSFLRADGHVQKLAFIHDKEKVAPVLKDFYTRNPRLASPTLDAIQTEGELRKNLAIMAFESASHKATWYFNLIQEKGAYVIDWFTCSIYQSDHIEQFLAKKSSTPTRLYVQIERGNYYNFQWADESKYRCYNLSYPGLNREIYGYSTMDTSTDLDLLVMTSLEGLKPCVLEVRFPEGAQDPRQVEILRKVAEAWLPQ